MSVPAKQISARQRARADGVEAAQLLTENEVRELLKMDPQVRNVAIEKMAPTVRDGTAEPLPFTYSIAWKDGFRQTLEERGKSTQRVKIEAAKPVFDGSRQSCRSDREFAALREAFADIERAAEALLAESMRVANKCSQIRDKLYASLVGHDPGQRSTHVRPRSQRAAVSHTGIDDRGELRECDINRLCALLKARQQHALQVLQTLGYRLPEEERVEE